MYKNTDTHKFCPKCEKMLLRSEFYKDSSRKDGVTAYCKPCKTNTNQIWRDNNPGEYKKSQLKQRRKREYGLSDEDMLKMLEKQSYKCEVCHINIDWNCHVDHNHETGEVRGLLCRTCNTGLGMMKDDISILQSAIEYLNRN